MIDLEKLNKEFQKLFDNTTPERLDNWVKENRKKDIEYSINRIRELGENWNGYGAKPIDETLIDWVEKIAYSINIPHRIVPTGRNSIQLEYEKFNGEYLEFEFFADGTINCLSIILKEEESAVKEEEISEKITNFYK